MAVGESEIEENVLFASIMEGERERERESIEQ